MKEKLAEIANLQSLYGDKLIVAAEKCNEEIREITAFLKEHNVNDVVFKWYEHLEKDHFGDPIGGIYYGLCWNGEKILYCFDTNEDHDIDWSRSGKPLLGESIETRLGMRSALRDLLSSIIEKINDKIKNLEEV